MLILGKGFQILLYLIQIKLKVHVDLQVEIFRAYINLKVAIKISFEPDIRFLVLRIYEHVNEDISSHFHLLS